MRRRSGPTAVLVAALMLTPPALGTADAVDHPGSQPTVDSTVEAGYTARFTDHGSPLPISATITVPALECGSTDAGVVTSVGLVEVPYRFAGGRVYGSCIGGAATYEARLESSIGGSEPGGPVAAGDRIKIVAEWNGDGARPEVDVTMTSQDEGWRAEAHFEFVADGFNGAVFRQVPMRLDGVSLPVAAFVGAKVARSRVNGQGLEDVAGPKSVLVDGAGNRLIVPSKIKSGGRFTFSYVG